VVRLARGAGLSGWVRNDAEGVTIAIAAPADIARSFAERLASSLPPLARIDHIAIRESVELGDRDGFRIEASRDGTPRTEVPPDAATCEACRAEVLSRGERRYRYPFATCTSCGPRYSIALAMPFDRDHTTLRGFPLCAACRTEYEDEDDRRYHAQAVACPACGPSVWLERAGGRPGELEPASGEPLEAVADLLRAGAIVAVKGVGGYHLLCDATNDAAVLELRRRKQRDAKPFALLARDLDAVERYALVSEPEGRALRSAAAPVVLLPKRADAAALSPHLAPRLSTLGFMLPSTPLQILVMEHLASPVVCTSANVTDEPPCLDEASARERLASVADWFLHHDRPIAQRVDDSVVRSMAGRARSLRRARGFAPAALPSPPGFESAPPVLALGGQLKSAVCLTRRGSAVVSQHFGDLDDLRAFEDWKRGVTLLTELLEHRPAAIAVDLHAGYRSTAVGRELGEARGLRVEAVQHHHAHIAANLWEHGHPLDGPPVFGVAFDGLGQGEGGELWGGELLLCRYDRAERLRALPPAVLLGGDAAAREPWRNLYAHLLEAMDWSELASTYGDLAVVSRLAEKPRALLEGVRSSPSLSPPCSSAGRLFDAVAAALDIHFESVDFEGQAAMELEALVDEAALTDAARGELYPISTGEARGSGPARWELAGLWRALLDDLRAQTPRPVISARFHLSLAGAIAAGATAARGAHPEPSIVALSGGVFQNKVLVEATDAALRGAGFEVWLHEVLPPNDGCLALGQAAVVAARMVLAERQE
jgi:hydrogenase maturation protein HypF